MGRDLVSELDLELILERILEEARLLTDARYAAIGILGESGEELDQFITVGIDEETRKKIGDQPRGLGILGELIHSPVPLIVEDLTSHPHSYGFPPEHPEMKSFLGVPIKVKDRVWGNIYLTEKRGGSFSSHDLDSLSILADWAAVAIHNANLYSESLEQRTELESAVQRLEATTTVARAIGAETDLDVVLDLIAELASDLIDARGVLILLTRGDELVIQAESGIAGMEIHGRRIPVVGTEFGEVLRRERSERLDSRGTVSALAPLGLLSPPAAALLVPLTFRARNYGVLVALERQVSGPEFSNEDEELLSAFAASAATAVATAKSVEMKRLADSIKAAEAERARWARELHDETLQNLGMLQVLLSTAERRPGGVRGAVSDASDRIAEEIEKLHAMITELRPAALDQLGLEAAVDGVIRRFEEMEGVRVVADVNLSGSGAPALDRGTEETVYRVLQESLNNVAKHASATSVRVSLIADDERVRLTVDDDGIGFSGQPGTGAYGLRGMRERIELVGGTLSIISADGQGTSVMAEVPVRVGGREGAGLG